MVLGTMVNNSAGYVLRSARSSLVKRRIQILLIAVLSVGLVSGTATAAQAPIKQHKVLSPKQYALKQVLIQWGNKAEYKCLDELWYRESKWNHKAQNPNSTAFGIPQFLDSTWTNYKYPVRPKDPIIQVQAGLRYIYKRYDTPCKALAFWLKQDKKGTGWY